MPKHTSILAGCMLLLAACNGSDDDVADYLPDGFGIKGKPILRHSERGVWAGCHLRIRALDAATASSLQSDGRDFLVSQDFPANDNFRQSDRRRVTGWEQLENSAIANPIGWTGTSCHGFDRHKLRDHFDDETAAFYMRVGGESHVAYVAYPDSGRIIVIVHGQ